MTAEIQALFRRHEENFNRGLAGDADLADAAKLFTAEFIAASPAGVFAGRNDESLIQAMQGGYAHYRATGALEMRVRDVAVTTIDDRHAMAKVAWSSRYRRKDGAEVSVDFDVTYFVQDLGDGPKIFGWVSGDEEALLREQGLG